MSENNLPLLARQPILNQKLQTVGYELLCRPAPTDTTQWQEAYGDKATTEVLISAFNELGIEKVTQGLPAFINFTEYWLHNPPEFTNKKIVAEVLEYILPTAANIAAVKHLHEQNFTVALDDFTGDVNLDPFIPYIDIIKIDLRQLDNLEQIHHIISRYQHLDIQWLAEKVETEAEFKLCLEAGCTLFQGYFFSRPTNLYGDRLPDSHISVMRILKLLNQEDININELANNLKMEPQLSFKLLRMVNSVAFGVAREITSIHQAVLLIGINKIRSWSSIVALGKLAHKPEALREQAVVRAHLCQKLSERWPARDSETGFLLGLFSLLPAFINKPMFDLCQQINLPTELSAALIGLQGEYGEILSTAIMMERAEWQNINWDKLAGYNIPADTLKMLYVEALNDTHQLLCSM